MICLLSENSALFDYLASLLDENGMRLCQSQEDASLCVVDLDTMPHPKGDVPTITISSDLFVVCDLLRPFSQDTFLALVKEKREGVASLDQENKSEERAAKLRFDGERFFLNGNELTLTPAEASLLLLLYQNRGKAVLVSACAAALGASAGKGNMHSVYINHLRHKIDYPLGKRMIVTVRNNGYMLLPD